MTIQIYNTLTRKKEELTTVEPGIVSMYVCGPTVYADAHVGHAMSSLVFDIIRRYLEYRGYQVRHVMNYTDVDDKIILRAMHEEVDPIELAGTFIQAYDRHIKELNILPATAFPRVTEEMDHIIEMISGLIEKGSAYPSDGDVYFRVEKDEDYGKLSGRKIEDMQAGARIDVDDRKEHPMDFALWKAAKEGEPSWPSPWGEGRPGWHIECSVMSLQHLGEQIDIHGGGNDLIFPHHENEIAQTESFTDKPFARYWVHNGMLQFSGEKMSKSLGNLVTIDEFLAENSADVFRLIVLNSSYRSPLTFTNDVIEQANKALERLGNGLRPAFPQAGGASPEILQALAEQTKTTQEGFIAAMNDDFNSAGALGYLFDLVRTINQARDAGAAAGEMAASQDLLREYTGVLGLRIGQAKGGENAAAPFVDLLIEIRQKLRQEKLWELSDLVRDELNARGVALDDSKDGTSWRWE
ncbi:MAG: cysteine--tRNA ligase [Anaerolineae bacterium]|nr:cysteine--tRNA ligase [Anaerolineae bacterium]